MIEPNSIGSIIKKFHFHSSNTYNMVSKMIDLGLIEKKNRYYNHKISNYYSTSKEGTQLIDSMILLDQAIKDNN